MSQTDQLKQPMVSPEISHDKPSVVTAFRVLLTFIIVGVVVTILLYIMRGENSYDTVRATKRYENLKKLNDENMKKTGEYAVIDPAKSIYQLPIKQAIILTARDLATVAPHAAYPIATPAAAAPVAPVSASANQVTPATATPPPPAAPASATVGLVTPPTPAPATPAALP